jgi:hypothetical protein
VQTGAGGGQLAQIAHHLGGDALARQQRRDARRVAGDGLARDPADGVVDPDRLPLAQERITDGDDALVLERHARGGDGDAVARTRQRPDRLGEVVGEALERLHGLAQAQDEHERGVGGQLDVDVIGGAQLCGELVAGHAGAAHVDDDP